jgi:hypothetical protein
VNGGIRGERHETDAAERSSGWPPFVDFRKLLRNGGWNGGWRSRTHKARHHRRAVVLVWVRASDRRGCVVMRPPVRTWGRHRSTCGPHALSPAPLTTCPTEERTSLSRCPSARPPCDARNAHPPHPKRSTGPAMRGCSRPWRAERVVRDATLRRTKTDAPSPPPERRRSRSASAFGTVKRHHGSCGRPEREHRQDGALPTRTPRTYIVHAIAGSVAEPAGPARRSSWAPSWAHATVAMAADAGAWVTVET